MKSCTPTHKKTRIFGLYLREHRRADRHAVCARSVCVQNPAPFVDGGIRDVAPLTNAVKNGYSNIICVVCQPALVGGLIFDPGNLLGHIERVMDIVVNELVENDLKVIKELKAAAKSISKVGAHLPKSMKAYDDMPIPQIYRPLQPIDYDIGSFTKENIATMIGLEIKAVSANPPKNVKMSPKARATQKSKLAKR